MSKYPELSDLEGIIDNMDPELQRKYLKWIKLSNSYISFEKNFKPEKNAKYSPGDVLTINFGFNVGAEFGGRHYGVVIEDNNRSAGTVMVIPLSSCSSEEEVKEPSIYLGLIKELNYPGSNEWHSFAVTNQIRSVSKLRISEPVKPKDSKFNIGRTLLEKIYANVNDVYISKYPNQDDPYTK